MSKSKYLFNRLELIKMGFSKLESEFLEEHEADPDVVEKCVAYGIKPKALMKIVRKYRRSGLDILGQVVDSLDEATA